VAAPLFPHIPAFRRTGTHLGGAALAFVGILTPVVVLAARGGSSTWLAQTLTMATIAGVGIGAMALPDNETTWTSRAWMVVACFVAAAVLVNLAFAWIDLDAWVWRAPAYIPPNAPIGSDFRLGGYNAARAFSTASSGWPPLTVILFLPTRWMSANTAYVVDAVMLISANIASVVVATMLAMGPKGASVFRGPGSARSAIARLAPLMIVWLFASYGFLLSMNRGNIDAFCGLLAVIGLASIMRRPHDVWTPAVLLALATNIKVYPAALFLLLIWRFRWRSILPIVVTNTALAFVAGPQNLARFLRDMHTSIATGSSWVGNSSAQSFSAWIDWLHPWYLVHVRPEVWLAIPVTIFLFTAARLWRRRDAGATMLMTCALFPLMFSLPSVSHDYKTVLLTIPFVLMFGYLLRSRDGRMVERWWMLLVLAVALFFCARAPGNLPVWTPTQIWVWPALLMNKYLPVLLLQLVVAWMAWRLPALDDVRLATADVQAPEAEPVGAASA
jgi:Glycosyltransferase family 87